VLLVTPVAAFALLGAVSWRYPQILGNGKDLAHGAFLSSGHQAVTLLLALVVLKPLATALCVGSGVTGGLFTPTMSTGAVLGALLGQAWTTAWPGTPVGAFAIVAAAAAVGAAMQTPLAALALMVELTRTTDTLIVPMIAATVLATVVARYLDGYSIYSSRLPARSAPERAGAATEAAGERL
jgi:H+/Cl- antiporter ClcA